MHEGIQGSGYKCGLLCLMTIILHHMAETKGTARCYFSSKVNAKSVHCLVPDHQRLEMDVVSLSRASSFSVNGCNTFTFIRQIKQNLEILEELELYGCFEPHSIHYNDFGTFPNLRYLRLHNYGLTLIEEGAFKTLTRMKSLVLARNVIYAPAGILKGLHLLEVFDLSYPHIRGTGYCAVNNYVVMDMPSLMVLLLPGVGLSLLPADGFAKMFHNNTNLTVLDISDNGLHALPRELLALNTKLEVLDVSKNKLTEFTEVHIAKNVNIKKINIGENQLKTVEYSFIFLLNNLGHTTSVNMMTNDITCNYWNTRSLDLTSVNFQYDCWSGSEKIEVDRNSIVPTMLPYAYEKEQVLYYLTITLPIGDIELAAAVGLVLFVALVCLYRQRNIAYDDAVRHLETLQDIQQYMSECRDIFMTVMPRNIQDKHRKPQYLAFLSYCESDAWPVVDKILKPLQNRLELNITMDSSLSDLDTKPISHEMYFLPGSLITENIDKYINDSWVTIVIVSDSFIESTRCHFEVQTAFYSGVPIIPLYLTSCDPWKLKGVLKILHSTKTRLEWPETSGMTLTGAEEAESKLIDKLARSVFTNYSFCKHKLSPVEILYSRLHSA